MFGGKGDILGAEQSGQGAEDICEINLPLSFLGNVILSEFKMPWTRLCCLPGSGQPTEFLLVCSGVGQSRIRLLCLEITPALGSDPPAQTGVGMGPLHTIFP